MRLTNSKTDFGRLRLRQLDETLQSIRNLTAHWGKPRGGWIKEIRKALGMTSGQLAARMDLSQSNVASLETREKEGRITLNSLRKAADALDCDVVYFLVPRRTLEETIRNQLRKYVHKRLSNIAYTMALEEQAVSNNHLKRRMDEELEELMRRPPRDLWA